MGGAAGWYGKLPGAGDFVGRRLDPEFQGAWDEWLQRGMTRSRTLHGDRWLDLYLTFPVWRFLIPAGHLGAPARCGVLLPSVDRVGRSFPLTICESLEAGGLAAGLRAIDAHLEQFAQAGLDALDGMTADAFDQRIAAFAPMPDAPPDGALPLEPFIAAGSTASWHYSQPLAEALARAAECAMLGNLVDRALWWLPSAEDAAGEIRLAPLPLPPALFDELITTPAQAEQ